MKMTNTEFWIHNNFFNQKEINEINIHLKNNYDSIEEAENTAKDLKGVSKKNTKTFIITQNKIKEKIQKIYPCIDYINNQYFGYDLYPFNDFQNCFYNIYNAAHKGNYDWHIDSSRSDMYDMKLTVLINLSVKNYEGGEFCIFNGNEYEIPGFKA